jgi:hypothetical protein
MSYKLIIMGILSGLIGVLGCGENKTKGKKPQVDKGKVESINPNDILFTTPTINNGLPSFITKTDSCVSFHEDEWRQIEFISKSQKTYIDAEIAKIKDIYDNHSHKNDGYVAFKNIAARTLITKPLQIKFNELKSLLSDSPLKTYGLGLESNPGQVNGGFYFSVNGVNYYGIADNNIVSVFGIYGADSEAELRVSSNTLAKLLEAEKLFLVDWRAMHVFDEINIKTDLVPRQE